MRPSGAAWCLPGCKSGDIHRRFLAMRHARREANDGPAFTWHGPIAKQRLALAMGVDADLPHAVGVQRRRAEGFGRLPDLPENGHGRSIASVRGRVYRISVLSTFFPKASIWTMANPALMHTRTSLTGAPPDEDRAESAACKSDTMWWFVAAVWRASASRWPRRAVGPVPA